MNFSDTFRYESVELLLAKPSFRNYEIDHEISRGGMGVIYLAKQKDLGRVVALKLLLQRNPSTKDIARFRREALALAQLKHPNIVRLYDFGIESSIPYVIMEYIDGKPLSEIILESYRFTGESPDLDRCLHWIQSICHALAYCHDGGVIHRDIKPENILIETDTDRAVLLDFGLVKEGHDTVVGDASGFTQNLSQTGAIYGTPSYMSPEQLDAGEYGEVGRKSDVWSLGATLFFCLTGDTPYPELGFTELITWRVRNRPRRARSIKSSVPRWLDKVCARVLAKDVNARPSIEEFSELLEIPDDIDRPRWPVLAGVGAVMFVTLGALIFLFMQHEKEIADLKKNQVELKTPSDDAKKSDPAKTDPQEIPKPEKTVSTAALGSLPEWSKLRENEQKELMIAVSKRMDSFRFLGLKQFRCSGYGTRVGQFQHIKTGMTMHLVPGGEFTVAIRGKDVSTRVSPFLIGQRELTQEEWDKGTVKGLDSRVGRDPGKPMNGISWTSAKAWGAAYSFRIPSEAEWMWAYRGGHRAAYYWGERPDRRYFWSVSNAKDAHEAKDHHGYENGFGLLDMAGNISEFVSDGITVALPEGHIHKSWPFRLIRGGSFKHDAKRATVTSRTPMIQQGRSRSVGVRFVFSIPGFPTTKATDYGRHFDFTKIETPSLIALLYNRERWNQASKGTQNTVIKQAAALLGKKFKILGVKTTLCGKVQHRVGSLLHIPTNMKFRLIPGGRFVMGDRKFPWTSPESTVQVAPFLMAYFPVTQEQFDRVGGTDKREQKDPLFPIHNLSYNDAKAWLAKVGDGFRLPSESEWEYAARAGTRGRYFWGEGYNPRYCHVRTHKNPLLKQISEHRTAWNAFGLSDVLGHVWELCDDSWIADLKNIPQGGAPRVLKSADKHVVRGHSTWDKKEKLRVATRRPIGATDRARSVGFRVCISIPRLRRKR